MLDLKTLSEHPDIYYSLLALLSLAVGSLENLVIYRLPLMLQAEALSLFLPRSFCPHCKKTIKARHNIPILSYLLLGGRCAYCKSNIRLRYPLIEALTCLLSLFACWHFGFSLQLAFALLFIWILIALVFIDLDYQLLPDSLSLALLWLGLIANTQSLFTSLPNAVLSAAVAYLSLFGFIKLYYLLRGKIGMGNGDFKLFAAFGAWFGWSFLPLILFMASFMGAIVGLCYLKISNKPKDCPIPFGPFLCFAGFVVLFWKDAILNWYLVFP